MTKKTTKKVTKKTTKKASSFCPFETITNKIIESLEKGVIPWRCGWDKMGPDAPMSLNSGKPRAYSGINNLILGMAPFESKYWLTFKQIKALGGTVLKGEKSSPACFFKWQKFTKKEESTGEETEKMVPLFKVYAVFNLNQTKDIPAKKLPADAFTKPDYTTKAFKGVDLADELISEAVSGKLIPEVKHDGGSSAFYRPGTDSIHLPKQERFNSSREYYGTLFHEAVHSTGHSTRLHRALDTTPQPFGSPSYSREELVAELGACFLMKHCRIEPDIANSSAYIDNWIKVLKGNKKLIPTAGAQASKAHKWITGEYQSV